MGAALQDLSAVARAEPIGVRLKRLRLDRGLSQRELSSPGVSYAYISRIEAGARTPSVKALRMLAPKLQVSVEYLETGRDIGDVEERELELADAELELRLAGNGTETRRKLEELLEQARLAGDVRCATRADIALALLDARRGNYLDTAERLERTLGDGNVAAHARPDAFAALGQAYTELGAPERSVRLFERCLADVHEHAPDDVCTRLRYSTLLGDALAEVGDHALAAKTIRDAVGRADGALDPHARAVHERSLARAAAAEGRSTEALDHVRRAVALLDVSEETVGLARAQLAAASIAAADGDVAETRARLDGAESLLAAAREPRHSTLLHVGRARLAALEGDGDRAVAAAQRALESPAELEWRDESAALRALADGLVLQGDADGAGEKLSRAVDLLSIHGHRHDAAQACRRWSQILQEAGRPDDASAVRRRADELETPAADGAQRTS